MEALGGKKVIGIDIYMPDDLKERLFSHGKISDRLVLINQSSVDPQTIEQVKSIIGQSRDVLVLLDSFHTHNHVLEELKMYSPLVGKGQYMVCGDTIVEDIPIQSHRPRPWGPGNNPKTALCEFLKENDRFEIDQGIDKKLLFTNNPDGYLKCCKD
jgi:cephalosporin hydroxylase